jgi:hypothetical protein
MWYSRIFWPATIEPPTIALVPERHFDALIDIDAFAALRSMA